MFEGRPPAHDPAGEADDGQGQPLRPLSWGELTARLYAARELRAALQPRPGSHEGSFDSGSARLIAAHANGKHAGNHDDSTNRKLVTGSAGVMGAGSERKVRAAPRGTR